MTFLMIFWMLYLNGLVIFRGTFIKKKIIMISNCTTILAASVKSGTRVYVHTAQVRILSPFSGEGHSFKKKVMKAIYSQMFYT